MIRRIYNSHKGFSLVIQYLLTYALLQLTGYAAVIMAYYHHNMPAVLLPVLLMVVLLNPVMAFVAANAVPRNSYLNLVLICALGLTAYYKNTLIPIAALLAVFALTYAFRYFGWTRVPFNDLNNKRNPRYRDFFQRYCEAFRQVFGKTQSAGYEQGP